MSSGDGHPADLVIVGGGAAGLATAALASSMRPEWHVRLLGGAHALGAKLLLSGGGRCNLTHRAVTEADFSGGSPRLVRRVLSGWPVARTLEFFRELGIAVREEPDGRIFPASERARDVRDALVRAATGRGVQMDAAARVVAIAREADGFRIETRPGAVCRAQRIVLASGGRSYPATGSDGSGYALAAALGHSIVTPTPALVPLVLEGTLHQRLSGVSHPAELRMAMTGRRALRLSGSLLWTHFGASGPVVLEMSRHWLRARAEGRVEALSVSLLPGEDVASIERHLLSVAALRPRLSLAGALGERLPRSVVEALLAEQQVPATLVLSQMRRSDRQRLVQALTGHPLSVRDSRGWNVAEVTAGGVALDEVDCGTMASRRCAGLFLAGELLDVDGRVGGFNLQWAWSSAYVAARGVTKT